ncbi:MAG: sigma-70 family RNA polymerase sigma factor, partial [Rothia sp. (in: high G+C Gram-positive bacteria)]|nr:sigma-70 family RNA polymerase sigma factor [Rothia sp. (in: high G+C Gram-positive bacteria)]
MQTQHTLTSSGGTDEALLLAVLEGKLESYGELYERYYPMARAIAFKHTSDSHRVDDIVSEAFARILQALKNGKGPHSYLGGYLATTIAHLAAEYGLVSAQEVPSEEEHLESMGSLDETVVKLHESDEVISAFTSLPERWQTVLWLTEIEARKPREIASAMDLTPNAVSALAVRAKESLKEGFLRAHQNAPATPDCDRFTSHISPYVRGSLSQKRSDALRSHMEACNYCTSEYLSLVGINKSMRSWIFPVLAGLSIWTTDGASLVAPVMTGAAGAGSAPAFSTSGHRETAASSTSSSSGVNFSLLAPASWGSKAQLLAGAATLTAATVAVVSAAIVISPEESAQARITAEGYSGKLPPESKADAAGNKGEEKPTSLGSKYHSDPFIGLADNQSHDSSKNVTSLGTAASGNAGVSMNMGAPLLASMVAGESASSNRQLSTGTSFNSFASGGATTVNLASAVAQGADAIPSVFSPEVLDAVVHQNPVWEAQNEGGNTSDSIVPTSNNEVIDATNVDAGENQAGNNNTAELQEPSSNGSTTPIEPIMPAESPTLVVPTAP